MDADYDLMKAVKAVVRLNDSLCKVDDNDLHMELTDRFSESLDTLEIKLSASVAEIRKRRAESPWKGPFVVVNDDDDNEPPWRVQANGLPHMIMDRVVVDWCGCYETQAMIARALNAFLGYDAQGNDLLEGMGV